ncbi:MAG: endonuclease domain-containing protein, partial [Hyphomicrobiales bacterium]
TQNAQQHAKVLRHHQTDAEGLLWYYLRKKQLGGYKFRRQKPIGNYIVDFACMSSKVVVERDGGQHADNQIYDQQRDQYLQDAGFKVLRFWNNEVFEHCFGVLEVIYDHLVPPPDQHEANASTSPTPPQGGE